MSCSQTEKFEQLRLADCYTSWPNILLRHAKSRAAQEDGEHIVDPKNLSPEELDLAMRALPPQARIALETMARLQNRPAEDVLRDEIREYIAGRLPIVNIDAAIQAIQATAHTAGYLIGRLRRFAREMGSE